MICITCQNAIAILLVTQVLSDGGAWLNENQDAFVILPADWFNPNCVVKNPDLSCPGWLSLNSNSAVIYKGRINTSPAYKVCWRENFPENLNRFNNSAKNSLLVNIGNYPHLYRRFFKVQPKEKIMLDIGAHIGLAAFPVASLGYRVVCFEPIKQHCDLLRMGIKVNRFDKLITLSETALSIFSAQKNIYIPGEER